MQKQITIEQLAPYLPYGLYLKSKKYGTEYKMGIYNNMLGRGIETRTLDQCLYMIPLLRPLSSLTKEITHNGEKFIPMVELAKIEGCFNDMRYDLSFNQETAGIRFLSEEFDNEDFLMEGREFVVLGFELNGGFGKHYRPSKDWTLVSNQITLWQKLYSWHFDIHGLIDAGLALPIND